jgi:hypothetical protein
MFSLLLAKVITGAAYLYGQRGEQLRDATLPVRAAVVGELRGEAAALTRSTKEGVARAV